MAARRPARRPRGVLRRALRAARGRRGARGGARRSAAPPRPGPGWRRRGARPGPALALLLVAAGAAGVAWGSARLRGDDAPGGRGAGAGERARWWSTRRRGRTGSAGSGRGRGPTTCGRRPGGGSPGGSRVLLDLAAGPGAPALGERVRVAGWMRSPTGAASPGWWRAWLARQGIAGRLRPERMAPAGRRGGLDGLRDRWRTWASAHAGAGLSGRPGGAGARHGARRRRRAVGGGGDRVPGRGALAPAGRLRAERDRRGPRRAGAAAGARGRGGGSRWAARRW